MYMELENQYAYNILENKGYAISLNSVIERELLTQEQFQSLVQANWSQKSSSETFEAFSMLAKYCSEHKLCISDKMFDSFIDHLTDNIKHATNEELKYLFYSLNKFPEPPSIRIRNFIEVWVALDDECYNRCKDWSHDELLLYTALFYMLNVIKYSDYSLKSLNKLASKAKQLTPGQLVQTLFLVGIIRKAPFDMHNLEIRLNEHFSKFTVEDLAIMSMGFFKSKTPIRDRDLVLKIIDSVIDNAKTIHEVSLAALLKLIRYSNKINTDNRIQRLLDILQHEVSRLSVMCNVHIAILGTSTMNLHTGCLSKIAVNVIDLMSQTRMKDLERLVLSYGTFNFIPQTTDCFFTKVIEELRRPERESEINNHGKSFACCVAYLGLLNFYPVDLINRVLSEEFLEKIYGKHCYNYGREILTLHFIAEIYCNNTVKNRLSNKSVQILAKKYTDYVPTEEYKKQYNVTERMLLDVMRTLRECRGGSQYVIGDHILPYHQRGDVIVCDDINDAPVDIKHAFPPKDFGLLRRPPNDHIWTVLVIAGRNALIYETDTPTGPLFSKIVDLEAIGYNAALVPWSLYSKLETVKEKADYLNNLIKNCRKDVNK
ncbi:unnamed protein product [Arctia plantaginis]|uniref:FAST kinase leucine-rich domain-containing protein n=1 Tax=Arctia plantaginis TaxID=874455 RepID=A0A8S0YYN2_ARCPL|nr:unnamed protein product [Arctia plantaginis]CAB3236253.1 unnamed protein product [Arctia plantaginis]